MRIHEAAKAVGCTQRAIKFYEEKGLLPHIFRSGNGYRDYSDDDIRILQEIQAYRKLGISIADIKALLNGNQGELLSRILEQKRRDAAANQQQIEALEAFIAAPDARMLNEAVDFDSIAKAMRMQLPGFFGLYLAAHFEPYLQMRVTTAQQREAYLQVLAFWDNPQLKLPLLYRIAMLLTCFLPRPDAAALDAKIAELLNPSEETYARLRAQTLSAVRMRENPLVRFNPAEIIKRRMMRSLRDCGYYDIFIPQMKSLSPTYKAYQDALTALNERLCSDLGLYYDSNFNLRRKEGT